MTGTIALISPVIDSGLVNVEEIFSEFSKGGWRFRNYFLKDGPASIETPRDVEACLPGLYAVAREIAPKVDAIIINCMCDPGLADLGVMFPARLILGPARTSMHVAAALGRRFIVLDVAASARAEVEAQIARYGVEGSFAGHRSIDMPVLQLSADSAATLAAMVRKIKDAARMNKADCVLLGCTAMAGFIAPLRQALAHEGVRIGLIEPVRVTIAFAIAALAFNIPG